MLPPRDRLTDVTGEGSDLYAVLPVVAAFAAGAIRTLDGWRQELDIAAALQAVSLGRDVTSLSDGEFLDGVLDAAFGGEQ